MQVYRLERFGDLDSLTRHAESYRPTGPGEVLVRVRATSLNFRDLALLHGQYPMSCSPNLVPHLGCRRGSGQRRRRGHSLQVRRPCSKQFLSTLVRRPLSAVFRRRTIRQQSGRLAKRTQDHQCRSAGGHPATPLVRGGCNPAVRRRHRLDIAGRHHRRGYGADPGKWRGLVVRHTTCETLGCSRYCHHFRPGESRAAEGFGCRRDHRL